MRQLLIRRSLRFRFRRLVPRPGPPGQRVGHDPAGNRAAEMPVPGDVGTDIGQDAGNQRPPVDESHDRGDGQWDEPPFQQAGEDQEGNQPENQAARPDVVVAGPSKEP